MYYQKLIHELDPRINPAGVEASMRLQYGTLDHLSRDTFQQEIQIARASEAESPGYLKDRAESYGMDDEFTTWQETLDHQAQDASIPQQVLRQLHSQDIPHKLQSQRELHNPDNPHIAPGWNALKLAEMLTSAFFLAAAAQTDFVPGTAHYPWLPLPQVEQAAPGTTTALLTALQDHEISDQLTLALQTELQAIASRVITDMPENTVHTLMNTAKTRVQNMMDQNHAHN